MKKLIITLAAMLAFAASAVETSIAYQGVLKNAAGTEAITGSQKITFRLYTEATGGTAIWESTKPVTLDTNGLFSVELADDRNPKEDAPRLVGALKEARGGSLYIGLEVKDSAGEILPRQKILMVPYASYAADVSYASDEFVVDGKATLQSAEINSDFIAKGKAEFRDKATFAQEVTFSGNVTVKDTAAISAKTINAGTVTGNGTIPVGGIIMWSGAIKDIPAGWALCNGQTANGQKTPDLKSRFIVSIGDGANGLSPYDIKDTGGYETVALTETQMPRHRHEYLFRGADIAGSWEPENEIYTVWYEKHKNSAWTQYAGGNSDGNTDAHENRPPYYALAFIMRVK